MRPLRLDMHGFAVFREPTVVDFTDADFFALVGPTGSGKSTVLDAVCFALYGTVPRWNDRRAVGNALAPSASEARVRLVFESAGARYVATRVVRRDGKGRVATTHAGLELLPRGFDLSTLDGELVELGEPLAGSPAEMEQAVLDTVGLPYDQFTSCVVLPQGQFAEFLHAKPAARQQILVNLLGLHVYERIREQATALATRADAQLAATDRIIADLTDATEEALEAARTRLDVTRTLAADVEAAVPALHASRVRAQTARDALAELDEELTRLSRVGAPAEAAELTGAAQRADEALAAAARAVGAAEEREEKLRGELAGAGDAALLRRVLDDYAEREKLAGRAGELDEAVRAAAAEHERALAAVQAATRARDEAAALVAEAERGVEEARTADRAATLRPHLREGQPCPVCTQVVVEVPAMPEAPALRAANARLAAAQERAETAAQAVTRRDRAARELDRSLVAVRTQREEIAERLAGLSARLADAPPPAQARAALDAVGALQRALDAAAGEVRRAREAHRRAGTEAGRAAERIRAAWRGFDTVRDGLAQLGPPAAERDDLAGAWRTLESWAAAECDTRRARRTELSGRVAEADDAVEGAARRVRELFTNAGLAAPADADECQRAAAVAVAKAQAEVDRVTERRAQADRVRQQRAEHEREGQVARALAGHLRANNFERWLLAEALDLLVEGASRILRELTGGQYDLVHDKGEFYVVDHHDAGLRRAVRTLSGGETFQASLALALALSEQLTGLSTGIASLESIVLDEGFGTLDPGTLDVVATTLESLAARGERMVGVVTHVGPLAERIPVRFEVRKDARTARVERTSG